MIPSSLEQNDQLRRSFQFNPSRAKVRGRMWDGESYTEINGFSIKCQLWHHGGMEESGSSLFPHQSVQFVNGRDAYWHAVPTKNHLFFHKEGWFSLRSETQKLRERVEEIRGSNPDLRLLEVTEEQEQELLDLGFVKVV